jgi:hypothetical protein
MQKTVHNVGATIALVVCGSVASQRQFWWAEHDGQMLFHLS